MTAEEVYAAAPATVKGKILLAIQAKGPAYNTAYSWMTGQRRPKLYVRPLVAAAINEATGENHTEEELWPEAEA